MLARRAIPQAFRAATRATSARIAPSTRFLTPFQIRCLSDEVRSAIDRAVASSPVVLFMKGTPETPQCGFSRASIQILGMQGVDPDKFTAFNVLEDQELRAGIKEYSEWPTIPQLYVDKEFIGGCDILMTMHQDGSLAKMLEEKGVVVPAEARAYCVVVNVHLRDTQSCLPDRGLSRLHSTSPHLTRTARLCLHMPAMASSRANSAAQIRHQHGFKTPNADAPLSKVVTVSAAGPFKARKLDTPQQLSARSAQNTTIKKKDRKREEKEEHSLVLAFKEKSEEYRRHLYSTSVARINKDLDALLNKLHEGNLHIASSDSVDEGSQASPLRLTVPARYQRTVQKLYHPLADYRYNLQRKEASGEVECTQASLPGRFQVFKEHIKAETEQIKTLQRQWEGVVAEIFQLGVVCLGESDIAVLLSTANAELDSSSHASQAESTLFVPEHSGSTKGKGKRKHVSFASPDMIALFPEFLFHTSATQKPVPTTPELPLEDVQKFEKEVSALGKQHSADLRGLEHEHKAWWERKQKQFAHMLMQD
ncbi:glutaredoxin [Stagonosporopsis vannaccii]|nr:glutaredoxin [Stagonosporopsis vannaccii]